MIRHEDYSSQTPGRFVPPDVDDGVYVRNSTPGRPVYPGGGEPPHPRNRNSGYWTFPGGLTQYDDPTLPGVHYGPRLQSLQSAAPGLANHLGPWSASGNGAMVYPVSPYGGQPEKTWHGIYQPPYRFSRAAVNNYGGARKSEGFASQRWDQPVSETRVVSNRLDPYYDGRRLNPLLWPAPNSRPSAGTAWNPEADPRPDFYGPQTGPGPSYQGYGAIGRTPAYYELARMKRPHCGFADGYLSKQPEPKPACSRPACGFTPQTIILLLILFVLVAMLIAPGRGGSLWGQPGADQSNPESSTEFPGNPESSTAPQ